VARTEQAHQASHGHAGHEGSTRHGDQQAESAPQQQDRGRGHDHGDDDELDDAHHQPTDGGGG
jgi:hypothetical protein